MAYDFNFGSRTAKGGFASEREVVRKFKNWRLDKEAQEWLKIMGYPLEKIQDLRVFHIPTKLNEEKRKLFGLENNEDIEFKKADVQIRLLIKIDCIWKVENISIKKISSGDYNQVDKRNVDNYKIIWGFDDDTSISLKLFTGEIIPCKFNRYEEFINVPCDRLRDKRRVFLDELKKNKLEKIIKFFTDNKHLVVADVLRGRGALSADWFMVLKYNKDEDITKWALVEINIAINIYCRGKVCLTKKGSLKIGEVIMQRKGGTPDPTKLQFKIKPSLVFKN